MDSFLRFVSKMALQFLDRAPHEVFLPATVRVRGGVKSDQQARRDLIYTELLPQVILRKRNMQGCSKSSGPEMVQWPVQLPALGVSVRCMSFYYYFMLALG